MQINYLKEYRAFRRYASENGLSLAARDLWAVLFDIFNDRAYQNGGCWAEDYIQIRTAVIMVDFGGSEDTMARARDELVRHGLISYLAPKNRRLASAYRMNWQSVYAQPVDNSVDYAVEEDVDNSDFDESTASQPQDQPQIADDCAGQYLNIKEKRETYDATAATARAREGALEAVKDFREVFPEANAGEWASMVYSGAYGSPPIMRLALTQAEKVKWRGELYNEGNPIPYLRSILRDWREQELTQVCDVKEYLNDWRGG